MRAQIFPVGTRRSAWPGRFLLKPSLGVAAWAEAHPTDEATISWKPFAPLAERLLHYVELGFAPSIANVPSLAKHEQPAPER